MLHSNHGCEFDGVPPETLIPIQEILDYLGVEPDKVAVATLESAVVTDILRGFCGRLFNHVDGVATYDNIHTYELYLPNPPVHTITAWSDQEVLGTDFILKTTLGTVRRKSGCIVSDRFSLTVDTGFLVIPSDLRAVFLELVQSRVTYSGVGGGGASSGEIKRISAPDVGTIEFNVSNRNFASTSGVVAAGVGELAPYLYILNKYRLAAEVGIG